MIKFKECIIFRPMNTRELNICHKLNIPFFTSVIYGANFPVFVGDLNDRDKYFKIIEEEELLEKEENERFEKGN